LLKFGGHLPAFLSIFVALVVTLNLKNMMSPSRTS